MPDEKKSFSAQKKADIQPGSQTAAADNNDNRRLYRLASRMLDIPPMERVYKLQRAVSDLKAPLMSPDLSYDRYGT